MKGKNIFTDEVHIHLLQLPAERERQEWSWQEGGLATRGCDSRQWAKRPSPSPHRLSRGCDCLSWGLHWSDCSLVEKQEKGGGRGGGVCSRSQRCGRGHTGEKCQEGGGQRREAAAGRHNIQTMVSPQHPCEVGWKVATIVMPTSQTRPGHRGKHTRGGLARQEGPVPSVGSPHIPAEPGPPATRNYLNMGDIKMVA